MNKEVIVKNITKEAFELLYYHENNQVSKMFT